MEVSDAGMETTESDDCRGVSKKNGDANGVLATTQEGVRYFSKNEILKKEVLEEVMV